MEWLSPKEPDTYIEAAELFRRLRARGITIRSTIDCLIANLATHHDALILSKTAT
jgi:predicted nucleic acid-binding protein